MNRPPKKHKKTKDDILNDPRFDRKDLEEADRRLHSKDALQGDDRNLVHVDDAFKEADIEDQVWLFWNKYKKSIIYLIIAIFLGVIAVEGYRMYQRSAVRSMQAAYGQADTPEALTAFGEKYAGNPLAGFALLQSADSQYEQGNYTAAAPLYKSAAASLANTYVQGRARLGEAMSQIQAGQTELGKNLLSQISADQTALLSIRAEATFDLGVIALAASDYANARRYFEQASALDKDGPWGTQADRQLQQTPELAEAASAPAQAEAPAAAQPATDAEATTTDASDAAE
ncbi:tetratricopeptide repeat protein [Ruficoccus amylovorans]|uniref:Tetratricopeptide repeat protein n=1 Tax=Ruficoccus amylovorans TaxID=1804625 RepID=A0A842HIR8_9BACT|nr:tetratricopeptide repeat protein [Ruficoccus amylovorans]MBC2596040.1 tetratricopeptide repeat protein [Ruficoccus amylovorans]